MPVLCCRRFLNRLLGMHVSRQALLFGYFSCTLAAEIQAAKADGRYFEGVSDLSGSNIARAAEPQVSPLNLPCPNSCLLSAASSFYFMQAAAIGVLHVQAFEA